MKNAVFWDVTLCGSLRMDVPPKRRFIQEPQGVTSQKTTLFLRKLFKWSRYIFRSTWPSSSVYFPLWGNLPVSFIFHSALFLQSHVCAGLSFLKNLNFFRNFLKDRTTCFVLHCHNQVFIFYYGGTCQSHSFFTLSSFCSPMYTLVSSGSGLKNWD
jgi:hypothetical protein